MVSTTKWGSSLVAVLVVFALFGGFFAPIANAVVSAIDLTSPNGGEVWSGVHNITWTATGEPGDTVAILLSNNDFSTSATLIAAIAYDAVLFPWDTTTVPDGTNYKIKVLSPLGVFGASSAPFEVDNTAPIILSVTFSPNSGTANIGDVITVTIDADENVYTAGAITVNGVNVAGTFVNNLDTTYTVTYTVLSGHTDRPAGTVPVSVVLRDNADLPNSNVPFTTPVVNTLAIDANAPTLSPVHIQSDNINSQFANVGDTVTLTFTSSEAINTPTTTIAGNAAVVVGGLTSWSATYVMTGGDTEGLVAFTVDFSDVAGNTGAQVISTSDFSSVTFDKTVPTISSITTKDSDFDGDIETATIVFDGAVDDSAFAAGNFTIGGVMATGLVSGTADDNTFDVTIPTGVAGTNVKQVNYTPGLGADMAGNLLAAVADGDEVETDGAGPVMVSALTTSITTIEVTFSEDLNGATVTNSDFSVTGHTLGAPDAFETTATSGIVRLTVTVAFGTGSTPLISLVGFVTDLPSAGSNPSPSGQTITPDDGVAPTIVSVTSATLDGSYNNPDGINVTVNFSEAVTSTGLVTVTLDTTGLCTFLVTNSMTGSCAYIIADGENSADLTTTLIAGVVGDQAFNAMVDFMPASNLGATSNIVVDTIEPSAFTVGGVFARGGTEVASYWNFTNTGVDVVVPVDLDTSLVGGTIQLRVEADGTYEDVVLPFPISLGSLGTGIFYPISAAELEAISGFSEGDVITFRAVITDLAGNFTVGTESVDTFTVDQVLPTVNAGIDREVNAPVIPQGATALDPVPASGVNTYAWIQESGPGSILFSNQSGVGTGVDTDISADTDGTYILRLTVTDVAGNEDFDEMTLIWDTKAPFVVSYLPTTGAVNIPITDGTSTVRFNEDIVLLNSAKVALVAESTDASVLGTPAVQGGDGASATLNLPYSGLLNGTTYRANVNPEAVRDVAGNVFSLSFANHFTTIADLMPPVVNSFTATGVTDISAILTVVTNENATCRYANIDESFASMTLMDITGGTTHTQTVTGLSPSTAYNYYVRCADTLGNTMTAASAHVSFTTAAVDTTPPVINSISLDLPAYQVTNDPNVAVTVTEDDTANTVTVNGVPAVEGAPGTWTATFAHSQVVPGTFSFNVVAVDSLGNTNIQMVFYDVVADDAVVPVVVITSPVPGATISGITSFTFTTDGGTTTVAEVSIDGASYVAATTNANPRTYDLDSTTLTDGSHTVRVRDTVLGTVGYSNYVTFLVNNAPADTTAPVASITVSSVTAVSALLTVTTDENATCRYSNIDEAFGSMALMSSTGGITHTQTVSGLSGSTDYSYFVRCADPSSNTMTNSVHVEFTTTGSDTSAPSVSSHTPATNATGVAINIVPTITFNEALNPTTVSSTNIQLRVYTSNANVDATITSAEGGKVIVITPASPLSYNTHYYLAISGAVTDLVGNAFGTPWTSSNKSTHDFTTGPELTVLSVGPIQTIRSVATADDTFANGWQWIFPVTVPSTEASLSMQFSDWTSGANVILVAGNTRFYSAQSSNHGDAGSAVVISGAYVYAGPLDLNSDLDPVTPGRQIQITVETKVPMDSAGGTYSASYGVKSE